MRDVTDKVAFVTGGSSGIGLGIARAFAEAGMKVAIGYLTREHRESALHVLHHVRDRILPIGIDVTDRANTEAAVRETISAFGKIHVLVCNAGVAHPAPLSQTTYDDWDWLMSVNLDGVFNCIRAFLPAIQSHGEGGHVIATSSVLGLFAINSHSAYTASKFAVVGLMEALRAELADTPVGVSVFCPGVVTSNIVDSGRNRPEALAETLCPYEPADPESTSRDATQKAQGIMDPIEAGRIVLRGMQNDDLYILSHPEVAPIMRERSAALLGSIPPSQAVSEVRLAVAATGLYTPIYKVECERQRRFEQALEPVQP
jgi:NAD(P)-dependent dehydrogenase (short-subunit alcohol dehydrogenase family)